MRLLLHGQMHVAAAVGDSKDCAGTAQHERLLLCCNNDSILAKWRGAQFSMQGTACLEITMHTIHECIGH